MSKKQDKTKSKSKRKQKHDLVCAFCGSSKLSMKDRNGYVKCSSCLNIGYALTQEDWDNQ